ncbi:MAG TPA: flagellar hook-associated protein FlgL [Acidobacteriaceae bacterium]|nr:flagellar hook-associated protein FlgL [Acidobacteriaceae bacterium]
MRVNSNLIPNILADLQHSQAAVNTALEEVSTGKRVTQPSDDPGASAAMVQNGIDAANNDQYTQNITTLQTMAQAASSALSSVVSSLTQAVGLGTEGANGTNSASNLQALASQVQGILNSVVSQANTYVNGTYLFGGTVTGTVPYAADPASPNGYTYSGNNNANSVAIGDHLNIQVSLPGSQVFSNPGNDVIGALSGLVTALKSGNSASIATATASVTSAVNYMGQQEGFYSNVQSQLNAQGTALQQDKVTLTTQATSLVGVDLATAATDLTQAETANSAALAAAAKVLPVSLLNYLSPPQ